MQLAINKFREDVSGKHRFDEPDGTPGRQLAEANARRKTGELQLAAERLRRDMFAFWSSTHTKPRGIRGGHWIRLYRHLESSAGRIEAVSPITEGTPNRKQVNTKTARTFQCRVVNGRSEYPKMPARSEANRQPNRRSRKETRIYSDLPRSRLLDSSTLSCCRPKYPS